MKRIVLAIAIVASGALFWGRRPAASDPGALRPAGEHGARPAPDFPTRDRSLWINSPPLSMSDLKGKVVLIDVWTYG